MKKGESKQSIKEQLSKLVSDVERKVVYYGQKTYVDGDHVYHVVRDFFLGLHQKSYEATYEDLIKELSSGDAIVFLTDEQKRSAKQFLTELSELQYSGRGHDAEVFKQRLISFVDLARDIAAPYDTMLEELIFEGLACVKREDKSSARKKYKQAKDRYESLPEHEQHRYYAGLQKLYHSLD